MLIFLGKPLSGSDKTVKQRLNGDNWKYTFPVVVYNRCLTVVLSLLKTGFLENAHIFGIVISELTFPLTYMCLDLPGPRFEPATTYSRVVSCVQFTTWLHYLHHQCTGRIPESTIFGNWTFNTALPFALPRKHLTQSLTTTRINNCKYGLLKSNH